MQVGDVVECHKMPESSFYVAVKGEITAIKNGWATIRATQVIDNWSILWEDHPTSCSTSAEVKNLELAA